MKNKILTLIIGILIGAIITTSAFLIYTKTIEKNSNGQEMMQMKEKEQNGLPSDGKMGEPRERQKEGTFLEMPSDSNSNNV